VEEQEVAVAPIQFKSTHLFGLTQVAVVVVAGEQAVGEVLVVRQAAQVPMAEPVEVVTITVQTVLHLHQ
jgi:hypothetical protein